MNQLQTEILRAHDAVSRGERGARARLEELQARFRAGGYLIERPAGPPTLGRPVAPIRRRRKPGRARIERSDASSGASQRPAWQLREVPYWKLRR